MEPIRQPILVEIRRGHVVESTHQVHAVVASTERIISGWGDVERLTMPRSAIKSIQLLPMLASGAADAHRVSHDEIALAASSHSAEPTHTDAVESWLTRIGRTVNDLECGPSDPINLDATHQLYRSGATPTALHNCCSGKHAGFLTLAAHFASDPSFSLPGYLHPDHGVQQLVRDAQSALSGLDLSQQTPVIDGCGIPVYEFPLRALAQSMARLVTPEAVPEEYAHAARRTTQALPGRSFLVSGTGRADHVLGSQATEPLLLKAGAEGVSMGALPERGLGFAFKCEDGAQRGVDEAVGAVLHELGALPERISVASPMRNRAGTEVGSATVVL